MNNKIMKKISIIIGCILGIIYSLIEPIVRYADTAPLDAGFGLDIPSWNIFIVQSFISICIGAFCGWLLFYIGNKIKKIIPDFDPKSFLWEELIKK
ncbi:hypothetical protein [Paralysiella testudinis]|uniref:Uncharacterized protein n=1 Tax=Paralysiella testudinis TaxID=2809020 RepID=A0A892ZED7_9NEIS|nr:hypothetical protein [Paralysiella testudinis]QRQ81755.1 hypothetical protein JQU52_13935 [Paralysiella testudinis]